MENELQLELIGMRKYTQWLGSLPDYVVYEIQNSGFQLHHLIGKYNGYLDEDMKIESLWVAVGLQVQDLPNILVVYKKIIDAIKNNPS